MLQTGNYLVPYVGSEPYFRKPPLVNWIAAASFKLSGFRTEWTARLPSALAILAVALAFVTRGRRALGTSGSLLAALIWLVNAGNMEKGRLIEIEAIYVSLTALAFIFWIAAYLACLRAGFVVVPLPPTSTPEYVRQVADIVKPRA